MTDASHDGFDHAPAGWQAMVNEVQARLDAMETAMANLRIAVHRLTVAAENYVPEPSPAAEAPVAVADVTPVGVMETPVPLMEDDAAREEVRRAVEEARNDIASGTIMANSTWTMPRDVWPGAAPAVEPEAGPAEAMRPIEAVSAELEGDGVEQPQAPADVQDIDATWVDQPADTFAEEFREAAPEAPPPVEDQESRREAVRLAVERARAEMESANRQATHETQSDEEYAREEVRRAVERMRSEMSWGTPQVSFEDRGEGVPGNDEEARRDEVRRAVEQARTEMTFGGGLSMYDDTAPREADGLKPEETQSLFAAFAGADGAAGWQQPVPDLNLPASIVIEDPEGRVELARVYDTLNRVDRSQAALLNYTPHSVTVGLGVRDRLPEPEVMIAAVKDAFGRECRVTTEGAKMSVKIGEGEKAA